MGVNAAVLPHVGGGRGAAVHQQGPPGCRFGRTGPAGGPRRRPSTRWRAAPAQGCRPPGQTPAVRLIQRAAVLRGGTRRAVNGDIAVRLRKDRGRLQLRRPKAGVLPQHVAGQRVLHRQGAAVVDLPGRAVPQLQKLPFVRQGQSVPQRAGVQVQNVPGDAGRGGVAGHAAGMCLGRAGLAQYQPAAAHRCGKQPRGGGGGFAAGRPAKQMLHAAVGFGDAQHHRPLAALPVGAGRVGLDHRVQRGVVRQPGNVQAAAVGGKTLAQQGLAAAVQCADGQRAVRRAAAVVRRGHIHPVQFAAVGKGAALGDGIAVGGAGAQPGIAAGVGVGAAGLGAHQPQHAGVQVQPGQKAGVVIVAAVHAIDGAAAHGIGIAALPHKAQRPLRQGLGGFGGLRRGLWPCRGGGIGPAAGQQRGAKQGGQQAFIGLPPRFPAGNPPGGRW